MKRITLALALAACLAQPAVAAGPLAGIVLGYIKDAIKEAVVSQVRSQVTGALNDRLGGLPGMGLLGALVPELGLGVVGTGTPALPKEAAAALKTAGLMDANAKPLTDAEWQAYARIVQAHAEPGEDLAADLAEMRTALAQMPQMAGLVRAQLATFRDIDEAQARMREAYAQMTEAERQQVAAETLQTLRELPAQDQVHARQALDSPALGLPDDLRQRIQAAR